MRRGGVEETGDVSFPTPRAKVVDGRIGDWVGESTRIAGTSVVSRGELVYQDHLFDDFGADDGQDAARLDALAPLEAAAPGVARVEAAQQTVGNQFDLNGVDPTGLAVAREAYGDGRYPAGAEGHADILEARVSADANLLFVLARIVTMTDPARAAVLVLLDTRPGDALRDVPFGSGVTTRRAEHAILLTAAGARHADLATGAVTGAPGALVRVSARDYDNAIEAAIPRALVGVGDRVAIAIAAGVASAAGDALAPVATGDGRANLMNAAFRDEPLARTRMERAQALALLDGDLDAFFADAHLAELARGATRPVRPTPGYHERVFVSTPEVSEERGENGLHQHYGLYIPTSWIPAEPTPLTLWLHWRGGNAHEAAAVTPRTVAELGEERGNLLVSPKGRGTSTWFVGVGHVDVLEAWADVRTFLAVDDGRTYVAGYSMGGFGSYLFAGLYPDRFAGAYSISGAVTQGAWLGVDEHGRDVVEANGGDAAAELTWRLLENLRHVPVVIHHGTDDQLVPVSGILRQAHRLEELGYRHRLYLFPGYEHYTQAVMDEWAEGARYLDLHARPEAPARVTFKVVPALERAVETVGARGATLDFDVDGAYWLEGLAARDGDFTDPTVAAVADVVTLARHDAHALVPEAGVAALGHSTPFAMRGLAWAALPAMDAGANAFRADLRNVASVTLDLAGMGLQVGAPLTATVTLDGPTTLRLAGEWSSTPRVSIDGEPAHAGRRGGALEVRLDAGVHRVAIGDA